MIRLLVRELGLVLLVGAFAQYGFPSVAQGAPQGGLFLAGVAMALGFSAVYAMAVLATSRMSGKSRAFIGLTACLAVFLDDPRPLGMGTLGLLMAGLAALGPGQQNRVQAAADALLAYGLPMVGIRWALIPLLLTPGPVSALALMGGVVYVAARGLLRLYWPMGSEFSGRQGGAPLVRRIVPDQVVGWLEGISNRRARPFATRPDGTLDEEAVSVALPARFAERTATEVRARIGQAPFQVAVGTALPEGDVEVVVRRLD